MNRPSILLTGTLFLQGNSAHNCTILPSCTRNQDEARNWTATSSTIRRRVDVKLNALSFFVLKFYPELYLTTQLDRTKRSASHVETHFLMISWSPKKSGECTHLFIFLSVWNSLKKKSFRDDFLILGLFFFCVCRNYFFYKASMGLILLWGVINSFEMQRRRIKSKHSNMLLLGVI